MSSPGVVDDVVGAEGADQVDLRRAAHAGDLGAERLGDLHRERADAAGRADDQHLLPRPGRRPWSRTACRAVSPEMGTAAACSKVRFAGLRASLSARRGAYSAKEPSADAEHLVARLRSRSRRRRPPRRVPARLRPGIGVLRPAQPEAGEADRVGQAGHDVPGAPVHAGRVHPHQHLVVADRRPVDLREPQDVLGLGRSGPARSPSSSSRRRSPAAVPSACRLRALVIVTSPVES